jgi:hypothetical protein
LRRNRNSDGVGRVVFGIIELRERQPNDRKMIARIESINPPVRLDEFLSDVSSTYDERTDCHEAEKASAPLRCSMHGCGESTVPDEPKDPSRALEISQKPQSSLEGVEKQPSLSRPRQKLRVLGSNEKTVQS